MNLIEYNKSVKRGEKVAEKEISVQMVLYNDKNNTLEVTLASGETISVPKSSSKILASLKDDDMKTLVFWENTDIIVFKKSGTYFSVADLVGAL
jgi:23S rRNA-/tRNA-specific pseudouridylate synthase